MEHHLVPDVAPSCKGATAPGGGSNSSNNTSNTNSSSSKLKRAFSMPRNPFQGSRGGPTKAPSGSAASDGGGGTRLLVVGNGNSASDGQDCNNKIAPTADDEARADSRLGMANRDQQDQQQQQQQQQQKVKKSATLGGESGAGGEKKIFRRLSVKKFINRIAQQMTYVNRTVSNHKFDKVQSLQTNTLPNGTATRPVAGGGGGGGNFVWPPDTVPGVIGLRNHGNTCFMNAVLQCLSHTDILAQYFVLDLYKADLKRRNKINAKKFGTKGELTEQLALVLKSLWTCKDAPDYSSNFKAVVDRYGSQFRSSTQHDAQEFLFWLLDKVHEDLNTATKRKYKAIKNNGRSDEVIAAETLANYVRCNNSFVQAVFQAQFRSSLSCPTCGKQSNTFDPFYCLSVPLPQLSQQPVLVKVIYSSQQPKQVKLGLGIPHGSPVLALREQLHADTGIGLDRMILTEICESGYSRVFCDSHLMSSVRETDPLYCIECPPVGVGQDTSSGTKIVLCLCNGKREFGGAVKRFGTPFCLVVNRDISYTELQKLLLKEMSGILRSDVFAFATPAQSLFRMRLQDPSCDADTYLEATVEHPLFTEMIDLALSVLPSDAGPAHVKLLLEWTDPERFFSDTGDPFVEHESVTQMREKIPASSALTLEQCFEHYTKAETLGQDNAWKCPHCQEYLPVVKTLGLWSLPDIMVIHLKRFRQQQLRATTQAAKLTNLVKFPLHGFDMTPHLARNPSAGHQQVGHAQPNALEHPGYGDADNWSPWRKIMRSGHATQTHSIMAGAGSGRRQLAAMDNRYDLYAVCYHQGDTLETGHYTAACKNPYDGQWYRFDDQRVSHVASEHVDEEIINNEAYLLFYQRRKLPADGSGECSGSSSSSSGDHWVSKIIVPPAAASATATLEKRKLVPPAVVAASNGETMANTTTTSQPPAPDAVSSSAASGDGGNAGGKPSAEPTVKADEIAEAMSVSSANESKEKQGGEEVTGRKDSPGKSVPELPASVARKSHPPEDEMKSQTSGTVKVTAADKTKAQQSSSHTTKPLSPSPAASSSLPASLASSTVPTEVEKIIAPAAKESRNNVVEHAIKQSPEEAPATVSSPSSRCVPRATETKPSPKKDTLRPASEADESKGPSESGISKLALPLREVEKQTQTQTMEQQKLAASLVNGGSRFSLPSSQQFQDILWRENMSELMHHRPSSFATYKGVLDAGDAVSLIRGANTCSKDTLLFIDQQGHGLDRVVLDDDDESGDLLPPGSGSRALWISPVTPHKLITVSPKN